MEISDTYWSARKAYLSGVRQGPTETAAELAVRVEDMVLQGKWPENETQNRRIDLYYKATAYYEVQHFIQDQTSKEGNELTWESLVHEAKRQERTVLEYKDFRQNAGNTGSTPTYDNPALNADAVGKFTRGRPQHKKGKGGGTGNGTCIKCGKQGHQGGSDCPAHGKKCRICGKPNHFEAVCYSRDRTRSSSAGKGKAGKKRGKKPFGKKANFKADSVVLRRVVSKGGNSVPSAPTDTGRCFERDTETRSFQDHHFKQSILPRIHSLAVKLPAGSMEVVQPGIRCTRIQTLRAGWPSTQMC